MNKVEALIALIKDQRSNNNSPTSYRRSKRALDVLGLPADQTNQAMYYLGYHKSPGEPFPRYAPVKGTTP